MQEYYKENVLRFCRLTLINNGDDSSLKIRLWINRVLTPEEYEYHEDYSTNSDIWEMCLTDKEKDYLERYLWENNVTDFNLEVNMDKGVFNLIATTKKEDIYD